MRSKAGITVSSAKADISFTSMPSISTLATITGSISGLIFISMGVPTASSIWPETRSTLDESSIIAESMFVPCSNSRITMLAFSLETELTFLMPPVVPSTASNGFVTVVSIFSGLAPGYVVITTTYGSSMAGKRSVVMPVNEITPSTSTSTTATSTV